MHEFSKTGRPPVEELGPVRKDPFSDRGIGVGDVGPALEPDLEVVRGAEAINAVADLARDDGDDVEGGWVAAAVARVGGFGAWGVGLARVVGVVLDHTDAGVPWDGH